MNHEELLISAILAASVALHAPAVSAEPFAQSPVMRARAAADEGPDRLRHFVQRTRMIYALNYADYALPPGAPAEDVSHEFGLDGVPLEVPVPAAEPDAAQAEADALREQIYRDMLHE